MGSDECRTYGFFRFNFDEPPYVEHSFVHTSTARTCRSGRSATD
jgi:hypothetical protein